MQYDQIYPDRLSIRLGVKYNVPCHDLSRRAWRAYEVFQATVHYRNSQSFIYAMNLNNGVSGVMKIDMTSEC